MVEQAEGPNILKEQIDRFKADYLRSPKGQQILEQHELEPGEVRQVFSEIEAKYAVGKDITDDVLRKLLPHFDSAFHRENGYRISTWPCIRKDIRDWFQNIGWKRPEDWPQTTVMLFKAVKGLTDGDHKAWNAFINSPLKRGFAAGLVSPILYCLNPDFPVINSKVVTAYKYCTEQLGEPDEIDAKLEDYLQNSDKVKALAKRLQQFGLGSLPEFDMFCHYLVTEELPMKRPPAQEYSAWLFVANPEIFEWEQAAQDGFVEWTKSVGTVAQKMLRQIKKGDRAFGYRARPFYDMYCELKADSNPYKTPQGTHAVRLKWIRYLDKPIPLSTLKQHEILKELTFVRASQVSVSGITSKQLDALESIIRAPVKPISPTEKLVQELLKAQYDTAHSSQYEELLSEVFDQLGFKAEWIGGPGRTDVLVTANLGGDTFQAVVDGKTCKKRERVGIASIDFDSIDEHRQFNSAEYAAIVAPRFSGGKVVKRALDKQVSLLTTETLAKVLRLHSQFPFGLQDLKILFDAGRSSQDIEEKLTRLHNVRCELVSLAGQILEIFDEFQLKGEKDISISADHIYLLLQQKAKTGDASVADLEKIDEVLRLLSNRVLQILEKKDQGYIMTISPEAARARVVALGELLSGGE